MNSNRSQPQRFWLWFGIGAFILLIVASAYQGIQLNNSEAQVLALQQENADLRDQVARFKQAQIMATVEATGIEYESDSIFYAPPGSPLNPRPANIVCQNSKKGAVVLFDWVAGEFKWQIVVPSNARAELHKKQFHCTEAPS